MKTTSFVTILIVCLQITGCRQSPIIEKDVPSLPDDVKITKNYLGAPEGETLPVTFSIRHFDDAASMEAYVEEGNAFLASKTSVEMEMRLAVKRSNSLQDAERRLESLLVNPEGEATSLPHFVLEQIAAFEMVQAILDEPNIDASAMASLARCVEVMRDNRNGSIIQLSGALERLNGFWDAEQISDAASAILESYTVYGVCHDCQAKNKVEVMADFSPESPMSAVLQRHQFEIDEAVSRLSRL